MDWWANELKNEVNNLLFRRLPGTTTIAEMEKMATEMWATIMNAWTQAGLEPGALAGAD
jgi:hypothetical protein